MKLFDLSGKIALVTGASRGIGSAAATGLAEAGANLIICSRSKEALGATAAQIESQGREALSISVDVSNRRQVQVMAKRGIDAFGRVDILVNCAGTISRKPATAFTDEEWQHVIDVNLKGTFLCCQEIGKHMIDRNQGGKIINVDSLTSALGVPNIIPYASSKGGVVSLTKSLAVEWAPYRINVNSIGPGYFRTEMTRTLQEDKKRSAYIVSRIPFGRWGELEDLKGAFVFLASPASDYVTGQVIRVDGGWTAA